MEKRMKGLISSIVPCSTIDNFQDTSTFVGFPKEPKDPKALSTSNFDEIFKSLLELAVIVLSITNVLFLCAILIVIVICRKPKKEVGQPEKFLNLNQSLTTMKSAIGQIIHEKQHQHQLYKMLKMNSALGRCLNFAFYIL
jgi:hypothetical protein